MSLKNLQVDLAHAIGGPVEVTLTRNRQRLVSVRRKDGCLCVRLHEALVTAPVRVRDALCRFVAEGCRESARLIRDHLGRVPMDDAPLARVRLRQAGTHHHLGLLLREACLQLPGHVPPAITWGMRRPPGARRVRLGSYDPKRVLIRVNPVLDDPSVPEAMLRYVIFHELVHHVLADRPEGRTHGSTFRDLEANCPDLEAANLWQRRHLAPLLTRARAAAGA